MTPISLLSWRDSPNFLVTRVLKVNLYFYLKTLEGREGIKHTRMRRKSKRTKAETHWKQNNRENEWNKNSTLKTAHMACSITHLGTGPQFMSLFGEIMEPLGSVVYPATADHCWHTLCLLLCLVKSSSTGSYCHKAASLVTMLLTNRAESLKLWIKRRLFSLVKLFVTAMEK